MCFDWCVCICQAEALTVTEARARVNCVCVCVFITMILCNRVFPSVCSLSVCMNEEVLGEGLDRDAGMCWTAADCC